MQRYKYSTKGNIKQHQINEWISLEGFNMNISKYPMFDQNIKYISQFESNIKNDSSKYKSTIDHRKVVHNKKKIEIPLPTSCQIPKSSHTTQLQL